MALISIKITDTFTQDALQATEVPGAKLYPYEYHITLVHLGDNYPVLDFLKAVEVASKVTEKTSSFTAELGMISYFPPKRGNYPIVCPVESIELQTLQAAIVSAFEEAGIPFVTSFQLFRPHVTLSYSLTKPPLPSPMKPWDNLYIDVRKVSFWPNDVGDDGELNLLLWPQGNCGTMYESSNITKGNTVDELERRLHKVSANVAAHQAAANRPGEPIQLELPFPPQGRSKKIFTAKQFSTTPASHEPVPEVKCAVCTAWRRADRSCFRCSGK